MSRAVWELLKEGYGAEDIALRLNMRIAEVRQCISTFRGQQGKLVTMYAKQAKIWWGREGEVR